MISEHGSRHDSINRTSARLDQPWIDHVAAASGDSILLLARILIGVIFVQSGFGKLMGLDAFATGLARNGIPAAIAPVLAPIGAGVEFVGGLAVVLGLATRYVLVPIAPRRLAAPSNRGHPSRYLKLTPQAGCVCPSQHSRAGEQRLDLQALPLGLQVRRSDHGRLVEHGPDRRRHHRRMHHGRLPLDPSTRLR